MLTAGIWYWHGVAPSTFAAGLGHANAAALGFGTNPLVSEVPAELVDACEEWGLTLFRVPEGVAFIEIAEEFVEAQHRDRERPLLDSLDRSGQFLYTPAGRRRARRAAAHPRAVPRAWRRDRPARPGSRGRRWFPAGGLGRFGGGGDRHARLRDRIWAGRPRFRFRSLPATRSGRRRSLVGAHGHRALDDRSGARVRRDRAATGARGVRERAALRR